jgi:hypothetical protein
MANFMKKQIENITYSIIQMTKLLLNDYLIGILMNISTL